MCVFFNLTPNYLLRNTPKSTQNERCNQRVWSNPTIKNSPRGKRTSSISSVSILGVLMVLAELSAGHGHLVANKVW